MLAHEALHSSELDFEVTYQAGIHNRATVSPVSPEHGGKICMGNNDDLPFAAINLREDNREPSKALPYTMRHVRDDDAHEPSTVMTKSTSSWSAT